MVEKKILGLFVITILALGFVVAVAHFVTLIAPSTINEDISIRINISINNTDSLGTTQNITGINITLPVNFTYATGTFGTDIVVGYNLTFNDSLLTITNLTAGVVGNASVRFVWFNVTAVTPRAYNITVVTSNSTKVRNTTYIQITVNDTSAPFNVSVCATGGNVTNPVPYANLSYNSTFWNITAYDNVAIDTVNFTLFNSSGVWNSTLIPASGLNVTINFSDLREDQFYLRIIVNDSNNNKNTTAINFTIDKTAPIITFSCDSTSLLAGELMTCSCTATDVMQTTVTPSFTTRPATAEAGTYSTTCTATDEAGNSETSTINYEVIPTSRGSRSTGSSSSTTATNTATNAGTTTGTQGATGGSTGESAPTTATGDQAAGSGSAIGNTKQGLSASSWAWIIVVIVIIVAIVVILVLKTKKKSNTYLKVKSR